MSWSVNQSGTVSAVIPAIANEFSRISLTDAGEMETVKTLAAVVKQCLGTFGPERLVKVEASGHMGYADWGTKSGPYQQVNLKIEPIHLTVGG